MTPDEDKKLIRILTARDATLTKVELRNSQILDVWNIAWGYDMSDDFAHVTTNISPEQDGYSIEFFFTTDVVKVVDPAKSVVLISFL
jgi:hypothetical protein